MELELKNLILCDDCNPKEVSKLCLDYDLGIEIQSFYNPEHHIKEPDTFSKHSDLIKDIPLRYLHGPFGDLCPGSFDSMVRDVAYNRFELAVENASKLNIHNIILHIGYVPNTSPPKNWIKRCSELWKDFLKDKPDNLFFYIENLFEKNPEFVSELLDKIDDTRVKACLDIGHAHCHSEKDVLSWIKHLGDKIGYVHLHNNSGIADAHNGLDSGTIPVVEVCRELNKYAPNASWALETDIESMSSSIDLLRNNGLLQ